MFQIFNARPIKKAMGNIPVGKFPISLSAAVAVDCGRRLLRRIYRLAKPYSYALCCSKQVQAPRFVFSGTGFKLQSSSRGRTFRMIPGFNLVPLRILVVATLARCRFLHSKRCCYLARRFDNSCRYQEFLHPWEPRLAWLAFCLAASCFFWLRLGQLFCYQICFSCRVPRFGDRGDFAFNCLAALVCYFPAFRVSSGAYWCESHNFFTCQVLQPDFQQF